MILTNAILVYARGKFVAYVLKLGHFVISNRNACRSPFKMNMICAVSICRTKYMQSIPLLAVKLLELTDLQLLLIALKHFKRNR